ncbi:MAG: NUDIX domain-containing protein [Bacteroidetes bacterium]|nr:NUDIX domain-containing protein [Bacteroidota bacterium]
MDSKKIFIIRVYGFIINDENEILVAEEFHYNTFMRKFPGGGLEHGEGITDCLRRELKEELGFDLLILEQVYITPTFVTSAFNELAQVIGVYYRVSPMIEMNTLYRENILPPAENGKEIFKWISIDALSISDFTFKTDQDAFEYLLTTRK